MAPKLEGLKVTQLSDLHLTSVQNVHVKMVEAAQALRPDMVLVTGDFVNVDSAVADAMDLFSNLSPPLGTWGVPGNWDHTAEAVPLLKDSFGKIKGGFLVNQSAEVQPGLWAVGVDDPASSRDDLDEAVTGLPAGVTKLLLAHSPDIVPSLSGTSFDLVLVGHTHGGQVNLPGLSGAWLKNGPTRQYEQGFFDVYGSRMYVNRGIGTTTMPLRVRSRPEVTLFTLHAA